MAEINNNEEFEKWLKGKPREVAIVLASRSALRVLPILNLEISLSADKGHIAEDLVLTAFRGCAASRVAAAYPTRDATAAAVDATAAFAVPRRAVRAAAHAAIAAAFAAAQAATIDAARAAAFDAARAATDAAFVTDRPLIWKAISEDCTALEAGLTASALAGQPLWADGIPSRFWQSWTNLESALHGLDQGWEVWTEWYRDRLNGLRSREVLEVSRVTEIAKEDWDQGARVVNARIAKLIEDDMPRAWPGALDEWLDDEDAVEPPVPVQSKGPRFAERSGQLDHAPSAPADAEAADAIQERLHAQLKERLGRLAPAKMQELANQYPTLAEVINDYRTYLDVSQLSDINVPALWMAGAGLIEQSRAFSDHDPDTSLTPQLEPEVLGLLRECARLHGGFIMGFEEGRKLAERARVPLLDRDELKLLIESERDIIGALLRSTTVELTDRARRLLGALEHQLLDASIKLDNAAQTAFPVVRNLLAFIGRTIRSLESVAARVSGYGLVAGLPAALAAFFQAHFASIAAFAACVPELREYFAWLYSHLDAQTRDDDEEEPSDTSGS